LLADLVLQWQEFRRVRPQPMRQDRTRAGRWNSWKTRKTHR
jgi:hypothetical protein